jgi:hypothetical protein
MAVSGRTEAQINAAKRGQMARLGGPGLPKLKRKKCKMGKSCGASCIPGYHVCMVDIPWALNPVIDKAVATVKSAQGKAPVKAPGKTPAAKTPTAKPSLDEMHQIAKDYYKKEWSKHYKAMNLAINDGNKQSYNFHRSLIANYHKQLTDKGVNLGPLKVPTWVDKPATSSPRTPSAKPEAKTPIAKPAKAPKEPTFVAAKGKSPKLKEFSTDQHFADKKIETPIGNPKFKAVHEFIGNIFSPKYAGADVDKFTKIRDAIAAKVGGISILENGLKGIRRFTGSTYSEMRQEQLDKLEGKTLKPSQAGYLKLANDAERLIAATPKEKIEKFRGIHVNDDDLKQMISDSKSLGKHANPPLGGALASWSTSLQVAQNFSDNASYKTPNKVIFRTVNKAGVAVEKLTSITREDEILTSGRARYKFTGNHHEVKNGGNTYHIFDVEEFVQ